MYTLLTSYRFENFQNKRVGEKVAYLHVHKATGATTPLFVTGRTENGLHVQTNVYLLDEMFPSNERSAWI